MPRLIASPTVIQAAGNPPKRIEEYAGRVNSGHAGVSVARMVSPEGWVEPGQRPEFEEITIVLRGLVRVEHEAGAVDVRAGQAVVTTPGEGSATAARSRAAPSIWPSVFRRSHPTRSIATSFPGEGSAWTALLPQSQPAWLFPRRALPAERLARKTCHPSRLGGVARWSNTARMLPSRALPAGRLDAPKRELVLARTLRFPGQGSAWTALLRLSSRPGPRTPRARRARIVTRL